MDGVEKTGFQPYFIVFGRAEGNPVILFVSGSACQQIADGRFSSLQ
jgi:hypothetical protein